MNIIFIQYIGVGHLQVLSERDQKTFFYEVLEDVKKVERTAQAKRQSEARQAIQEKFDQLVCEGRIVYGGR